ncbi:MAG: helix-turn-helix domain-containing protein [Candidatus Thermoplasmatota archaeon]
MPRVTSTDSLKLPAGVRDFTAHEFLLPSDLREFQVELAGRLVMHDEPGTEVKALREKYGFTQEFLSKLCDLRRESLSRIESGAVGLSLPFVQRFVRIMTLARGVREHLAYAESRGNAPDERHVDMLAMTLRIEPEAREEIVLASMVSYERKRREALRALPAGGRGVRKGI